MLDTNGAIINEVSQIEKEVVNHFTALYNTDSCTMNFPVIATKYLLHDHSQDILLAPICLKEIKNIIFNANINKIPGFDGFGAKVYKTHWEEINKSLFEAINKFFKIAKILKFLNHSFITLVSNVTIPNG